MIIYFQRINSQLHNILLEIHLKKKHFEKFLKIILNIEKNCSKNNMLLQSTIIKNEFFYEKTEFALLPNSQILENV